MITKETTSTEGIDKGLQSVRDIVASTIGPNGANVSMAGGGTRATFDDGYKAILHYVPSEPLEREAVMRVRDAAKSQVDEVGDGTSTTTILLVALYRAAIGLIDRGLPRRKVVSDFISYAKWVENYLEGISMSCMIDGVVNGDLIKAVATIAMHGNRENGNLIGGLVSDLGPHGMVTVEKSPSGVLNVERSVGYSWREGIHDRAFFNQPGAVQIGESLVILVNQNDIDDIQTPFWNTVLNQLWPAANKEAGKQLGLVLICNGSAGSVMATFSKAQNPANGERLPMLILKTPNIGSVDTASTLQDIAGVTGATVFDMRHGSAMSKVSMADLGRIDGVRSTLDSTTLALCKHVDDGYSTYPIEDCIKGVSGVIKGATQNDSEEQRLRLAQLNGAVGVIRVPVITETGLNEFREEIEDGYRSAMAALTDGVLPGGGRGLMSAAIALMKEFDTDTCRHFASAIMAPGSAIIDSSTVEVSEDSAAKMGSNPWMAIDLSTGEVAHAVTIGVLDSKKVVTHALKNAMSVSMPMANTKFWLVNQE